MQRVPARLSFAFSFLPNLCRVGGLFLTALAGLTSLVLNYRLAAGNVFDIRSSEFIESSSGVMEALFVHVE